MKKTILTILGIAALTVPMGFGQTFIGNPTPSGDDSGVFAYWNFNAGSNSTSGTFAASNLTAAFGNSTLSIAGVANQAEVVVFAGTVTNLADPDPDLTGRGVALAIRNGTDAVNNGSFIVFTLNMTNLKDLTFSFAGQRTSTGFNSLVVDYSSDGGSNWAGNIALTTLEGGMGTTTAVPASIRTVDLSAVSALDNINNAQVRLTFDGGSTTSSAGNNRLDNFQFNATVVPEPSSVLLLALGVLGMMGMRRRR